MKQSTLGTWISALVIVTGVALGWSALSLPGQPYAGLLVRSGEVVSVVPGGPAARAGIREGDRLSRPGAALSGAAEPGPLSSASPSRPLLLERHGTPGDAVWLVPERLPAAEWRFSVALFTVAAGFLLLASLVWAERRDRLTRSFVLLGLGFAWLLVPFPRFGSPAASLGWALAYTVVTLFVPALCLHFFSLFPEPRRAAAGGSRVGRAGYAISAALLAGTLLAMAAGSEDSPLARLGSVVEGAAAIWFALGILGSFALFARSYARAGSADARRRLRVALLGLVVGAGPLALATFARSVWSAGLPFDRLAVPLTLLIPASFAWAIAVHRLFDIGVALRVGAMAAALALGTLAAGFGPDAFPAVSREAASVLLLAIVAGAVVAGPLSQRLGRSALAAVPQVAAVTGRREGGARHESGVLLDRACVSLLESLRLDRCAAVDLTGPEARVVARAGTWFTPPALGPAVLRELRESSEVVPVEELSPSETTRALELAGVRWVLPVGSGLLGDGPPAALLLLGRRLAGAWLGRHEMRDLGRLADHLGLAIENATLRREARSRDAFDRELAIAGDVQAHRLPRRAPVYPTLDCAAAALSCEPVGGDYYDFIELSPREFALAVGDAAGKGVPAALVLAGVQTRFKTEASRGATPGSMLRTLNRELVAFDQPDRFMGLLCARVDVRRGRVFLANAGLTPPIVRRRDGRFETITTGGVLLGVSRAADYADVAVELGAGDLLVLHTDGLTEARRGDEMFGSARVEAVLDRCAGRRATDVLEALLQEVRRFSEGPLDDITVVVLRQLAAPAGGNGPLPIALKSGRETAESMG